MSKSGSFATVAFYGPNDQVATKAVVGIFSEDRKLREMRKWFSGAIDLREDQKIQAEIIEYVKQHKVVHVTAGEGVMGCPHEEGIDYPNGVACPMCDFWKGRDRFANVKPRIFGKE